MLKKRLKFITEFLIPSLDSKRFGNQLKWLDRENSTFQLGWCHKGVHDWSELEAQVFVEWDKIKGRYQPDEKQYFTTSKQRFRCLLNKLSRVGQIKKMESKMNFKKVYCITGVKKKCRRKGQSLKSDSIIFCTDDTSFDSIERPSEDAGGDEMNEFYKVSSINNLYDHNYCLRLIDNSAKKHRTVLEEENQNSIPIPVACRRTSVDPETSNYEEESCSSSSSPEYCVNDEDFDETDLELSYEYFRALNDYYKHRMHNLYFSKSATQTLKIEKVEKDGDVS